jgi:protein TonB
MKICPQCNNEFDEHYNFCLKDGTPLNKLVEETDPDADSMDEQETITRVTPTPPIGEETIAMDERPVIGDETMAMSEQPPIGEETVMMDSPPVTDEADFNQADTSNQEPVAPTEEWQDQDSTEEWIEEDEYVDEDDYVEEDEDSTAGAPFVAAAAQIPVGQTEAPAPTHQDVQSEKEGKSYLGLIIGGLLLFALLIIGTAAGGVYWYFIAGNSQNEIASTNNPDNTNSETDGTDENSDLESPLGDNDVNADGTNSDTDNSEDTDKEDGDKDKTKDKTPTPTATPKKTPRDNKPTPTPGESSQTDSNDLENPRPTRTQAPPPPPPPPPTPRKNIPSRISGGVVNGKAISLPKPAYPAAARAVNAKGSVNVAVVIGKNGNIISASAVSGHPLLRSAAVSAARRARFAPTFLSGQAVEVSGVIVYNFQ